MKGIILAGGNGTRLYPLTKIINKHLLPVGKYPMIYYSIVKLRDAGITEILLVIGKQSAGEFAQFLGGGEEWGVRLTYKIQEESGGIAQALALGEDFIRPGEKFVVLLGDNLFEESLGDLLQDSFAPEGGARVILKEVDNPQRYGVPVFEGDRIEWIEEKPFEPKSNYCVTGIYQYDSAVFEMIKRLRPSSRGELEITDVNNLYAADRKLTYGFVHGWWIDAGTIESLYEASSRLLEVARHE
ncbi:sugar phosphate nucleotidyltransferase [Brevibacillus sp. B_LB10_24]|uniref:sugar phosphate nucleotidyltransferase n=1 Tax=Brevibacillus sp. B_LB10_24 TaxID=3380645 RepID=UPI0038B76BB5